MYDRLFRLIKVQISPFLIKLNFVCKLNSLTKHGRNLSRAFCYVIFDFGFDDICTFFAEYNLMDTILNYYKKIPYNLTHFPRCYHHFLMGCYRGMFARVFRDLGMKKGILDFFW